MVKVLRIINIAVAALAVVLIASPAAFGSSSDEQISQFLSSPSVVDQFKKSRPDAARSSKADVSPLVKEAKAFALYLNPPKPREKQRLAAAKQKQTIPRPTSPVSAKFKLIATSYHPSHSDLSLALIDEPGKGLYWVRESSEVKHLLIEHIKDGLVVVRDGQRTFEIKADRPPQRSLLQGEGGAATPEPTATPLEKAQTRAIRTPPPKQAPEQTAAMEEFVKKMKALQTDVESGKPGEDERAVMMKELASRLQAMRVEPEEARKLDKLGKSLKQSRLDPNRFKEMMAKRARTKPAKKTPKNPDPNSSSKK